MMTSKEACNYIVESRRAKAREHRAKMVAIHGEATFCKPFTEREKRLVKVTGKSTFNKGKKAAYNKIWRHYDV